MSYLFLLNEAIEVGNFDDFRNGILELITIEKNEDDEFLKHESVYSLDVYNCLCCKTGQEIGIIIQYIEQLNSWSNYVSNEEELDNLNSCTLNGFLGIDFSNQKVEKTKQIVDRTSYITLKQKDLWDVTYRNFWEKKEKFFPHLIMCGVVKKQISRIGESSYFHQIIEKLKLLNEAASEWNSGSFNFKRVNSSYPLDISLESLSTIEKYGNQRRFSLPNGGTEIFNLHIKTGDLRFHFFPDSKSRIVYIGYIGSHLTTISDK